MELSATEKKNNFHFLKPPPPPLETKWFGTTMYNMYMYMYISLQKFTYLYNTGKNDRK